MRFLARYVAAAIVASTCWLVKLRRRGRQSPLSLAIDGFEGPRAGIGHFTRFQNDCENLKKRTRMQITTKEGVSTSGRSLITAIPLPFRPKRRAKDEAKYSVFPRNERAQHQSYSMLIFMSPSLVSVMPCSPILLGPRVGVMLILPALFDLSPVECPLIEVSLPALAVPHRLLSRCAGDCEMTGLLCTLRPGDTARRLIDISSKSSSRRRLFDFFSPSAAEGGFIWPGVEARDAHPLFCSCAMFSLKDEMVGESMFISSLIADDSAREKDGGGGVWAMR